MGVIKEFGAVSGKESDAKFNEAVFEFNSVCEGEEEMYYDATSGEVLEGDWIREGRKFEMEMLSVREGADSGVLGERGEESCRSEVG